MTKLVKAVQDRLDHMGGHLELSAELVAAERLSDQFADVKPDAYVLPLDAMAGFSAAPAVDERDATAPAAVLA